MTMVCLLQTLMIGIPLLILIRSNEIVSYFVMFIIIFVVTTAVLGLMFVPKMVLVRQRATEATQTREIRSSTPIANTSEGPKTDRSEVVVERFREDDGTASSVIIGTF